MAMHMTRYLISPIDGTMSLYPEWEQSFATTFVHNICGTYLLFDHIGKH